MKCRKCGKEILVGENGMCADCVELANNPDGFSKRKTFLGAPFHDVKQVDEADRFELIAKHLRANPGKDVGVIVDKGPSYEGKGERYIAGILAACSEAKLVRRETMLKGSAEVLVFKL